MKNSRVGFKTPNTINQQIELHVHPFDNVKMEIVANKDVDIPKDRQNDIFSLFSLVVKFFLVQNLKAVR